MNANFNELLSTFRRNYIGPTDNFFTLLPGIYEVVDINKTLKTVLPSNVMFDITIGDNTMRTNLSMQTTKTEELFFLGKSFSLQF